MILRCSPVHFLLIYCLVFSWSLFNFQCCCWRHIYLDTYTAYIWIQAGFDIRCFSVDSLVFLWLTVILETRSPSSVLCRSLSLKREFSSFSWPSTFFFLCSTSCLALARDRRSALRSADSFSRACLAFSRPALTWAERRGAKWGTESASVRVF